MDTWELNVLGIADWRDPRWKLAGLLAHLETHPELPGAVVEMGVYKGRCLVALALAMQEERGQYWHKPDPLTERTMAPREVWGYDGFEGLPRADPGHDRIWGGLKITDAHRQAIERMNELDPWRRENRRFHECSVGQLDELRKAAGVRFTTVVGWPPDVPADPDRIAAASLDCDLYDSYRTALPWIWERLVPGGYVHLDEYYSLKYPGPRRFVDEWLAAEGLRDCLHMHERIPREFERWYLVKPAENGIR